VKHKYNVHIFDVTDLCPISEVGSVLHAQFVRELVKVADTMTRLLPEYYVKVRIDGDFIKLVFTRVEPPEEEHP